MEKALPLIKIAPVHKVLAEVCFLCCPEAGLLLLVEVPYALMLDGEEAEALGGRGQDWLHGCLSHASMTDFICPIHT
jgi:hypothetical protein